jgi:hypothetical protein
MASTVVFRDLTQGGREPVSRPTNPPNLFELVAVQAAMGVQFPRPPCAGVIACDDALIFAKGESGFEISGQTRRAA